MLSDTLLKRLCRADSASKSEVIRVTPKNSIVFTCSQPLWCRVRSLRTTRWKTKNPPFPPNVRLFPGNDTICGDTRVPPVAIRNQVWATSTSFWMPHVPLAWIPGGREAILRLGFAILWPYDRAFETRHRASYRTGNW